MAAAKLVHPHPRELGATRFFARLIAFDLECPRCGKVFRVRRLNRHKLAARTLEEGTINTGHRGVKHTWNPTTARFLCTGKDGCQKEFVLGVLAWDVPRGAKAGALPMDQVPTVRQLAEMRTDGQGHWMPHESKGRMSNSNLAITDERGEDNEDDQDEQDEEME